MVIVENLKENLKRIKEKNKDLNIFLELRDEKKLFEEAERIDSKIRAGEAGRLAGKTIGIKANMNVEGLHASCASKTMENYESTYDATVVEKIKEEDGLILGIVNCDEFACGSSGETSAFGPCKNPRNTELIPGGSSSGSAAAVAAGFCDLTLGSDTGGSIRNPASNCGVIGIKPTYGSVSRYGLISLAMSLDQIGPLGNNIQDCALLLDVIKGKDKKDPTSFESEKINLEKMSEIKKDKKFTVGILDLGIKDKDIQNFIESKIASVAEKCSWKVKKVSIPNVELAIETYYPLVYTEFFSGTRKFDGIKYGKKIEDSCGPEVLRRILGGAEVTKQEHEGRNYFLALKVKNLIEKEYSKAFNDVDVIVSPTVPKLPHKTGTEVSVEDMYSYDALTIPSNLAGNCSLSLPVGKLKDCPVGLQVMADKFNEQKMLEVASLIEKFG